MSDRLREALEWALDYIDRHGGIDNDYRDIERAAFAGAALATPAPLDVERLAIALRAWRGDYGEPLAADLPDAADLARHYAAVDAAAAIIAALRP